MSRGLRGLISLWCCCTVILLLFFFIAPSVENKLPFPTTDKKLRCLADELVFYKFEHPVWSFLLFSMLYVYKQSFAIPGSFILNLLAGVMFGANVGTFLLVILTTIGASCCFLISSHFAKDMAEDCFSSKMKKIRQALTDNPKTLFFYLLSIRLIPMTPHWVFNICSPLAGVPLNLHALTIAIGMIPYNHLCARAGSLMFEIKSWSEVFTGPHVFFLVALAGAMHFLGRYLQSESLPHHAK